MSSKTPQGERFWERLEKTPVWIFFLIAVLLMCWPLLKPIGLPLVVEPETQKFFNQLKQLQPNDPVLLSVDYEAGALSILEPGLIATWKYLAAKNVRLIVTSFSYQGPPLYERAIKKINPESYGWKYGENWVFTGYIPGLETAQAAFAKNIRSLITVDYYRTPIDNIPLMKNINRAEDFKLLVSFTDGAGGGFEGWVKQVQTPYKLTYICQVIDLLVPPIRPYYGAGQVAGFLKGSGGAGQLEYITGSPGDALKISDMLSVAVTYSLILVVLGNIAYRSKGTRR